MTSAHPLSPATKEPVLDAAGLAAAAQGGSADMAVENALVASALEMPEAETGGFGPRMGRLPVELDVTIPVRNFRVRNLLALEPSRLIESNWGHGEDLPLAAGRVQLAWCEFEVIDTQLAVRVTRLA